MRNITSLLMTGLLLLGGSLCVMADSPTATNVPVATPAAQPSTPIAPPNSAPTLVVLSGKLNNITLPKKETGSIIAMLSTDTIVIRVELAPKSFMDKIKLNLQENDAVTVTGMQTINKKNQTLSVAVQAIKFGDQTYLLRDAKNKPLWLPSWQNKKATGNITAINTPDATATGDARLVSMTLATAKGETLTVVLAPADYLAKVGLVLAVGDVVSVQGSLDTHADQSPLLAIKIISHGVTVILRDNKRKGVWEVAALAPTPLTSPAPVLAK